MGVSPNSCHAPNRLVLITKVCCYLLYISAEYINMYSVAFVHLQLTGLFITLPVVEAESLNTSKVQNISLKPFLLKQLSVTAIHIGLRGC